MEVVGNFKFGRIGSIVGWYVVRGVCIEVDRKSCDRVDSNFDDDVEIVDGGKFELLVCSLKFISFVKDVKYKVS